MNFSSHGSYSIETQGNILLVDARGPFNDVTLAQYQLDMKEVCQQMHGQSWASLVTYYGSSIFTPEAEKSLIEITKYRIKHGMVANASVILNSSHADLQQMQLRRVYQSAELTFHVFSDIDSAKDWLTEYLADQPTSKLASTKNTAYYQYSL
ncbi:MAG: hypothetical protein MJK12_00145 [Colwellia sp.]|nr:hypothetical protein [Colwellia sp.]